jgi:hypothetical protein
MQNGQWRSQAAPPEAHSAFSTLHSPFSIETPMPYQHIEQIRDRKGEKIFLFLTVQNLVGLVAGGGAVYLMTAFLPWWARALLVLAGALIGVALTFDAGGVAGYDRIAWWVRGRLRTLTSGSDVTPDALMGTKVQARGDRPLRVGGPVQMVRREQMSTRVLSGIRDRGKRMENAEWRMEKPAQADAAQADAAHSAFSTLHSPLEGPQSKKEECDADSALEQLSD